MKNTKSIRFAILSLGVVLGYLAHYSPEMAVGVMLSTAATFLLNSDK